METDILQKPIRHLFFLETEQNDYKCFQVIKVTPSAMLTIYTHNMYEVEIADWWI